MSERSTIRAFRLARVLLITAVSCAFVPTSQAPAQPATVRGEARQTARTVAAAYLGRDRISLDASATSVPRDSAFGFDTRLVLASDADSARVRFQLRNPGGRLLFQRTRTADEPERGILLEHFERETADLDLEPGEYPVEVTVAVERDGRESEIALNSMLFIYDPGARPLDVAIVARVGGQPLSDPSGRFVADPGTFTRARDDVATLSTWVISQPGARVTLAVSPLLLEEWRRISDGYEFAGPEGVTEVDAESTVPKKYAATLASLRQAIDTGRLELAGQGYSDPDISDLDGAGLLADVITQYEQGLSAVYASLETTPSTGTAPARGCMPASALPLLRKAGVGYAVVDPICTRSGDSTAAPSSYVAAGGLVVLVPDHALGAAIAGGEESRTVSIAFERLTEGAAGPLVLALELGAGGVTASDLIKAANTIDAQPWAQTRLARDIATPTRRRVALRSRNTTKADPEGYWAEALDARSWSIALAAGIGDSEPEALRAQRDSLIAECAAWAGIDGSWALADRGRAFASTARRLAGDILGVVALSTEPVTLAGTSGRVPVTIRNDSDRELAIRLRVGTSGGLKLDGEGGRPVSLGPGETLVEIPVDLRTAVAGDLRVSVYADGVELDRATVPVKASYLDRIAAVGAVVLILGVLLAFIIRRVNRAEPSAQATARPEAYTGTDSPTRATRR